MDNEVLSLFDRSKEYNSLDLFEKVEMAFNSKESIDGICSNCMWHDKCLFYQML